MGYYGRPERGASAHIPLAGTQSHDSLEAVEPPTNVQVIYVGGAPRRNLRRSRQGWEREESEEGGDFRESLKLT